MSAARHAVGASAAVPVVRACRLLRLVTDAACPGTRAHGWPPDRAVYGARGDVALVLRRRELCLRQPPISAHRLRRRKPPTYTVRTLGCPTYRLSLLRRA